MSLALIFYRGKAHKIEWKHRFHLALIIYHDRAHEVEWKQYCLEALHPALVYCPLLEISLVKDCLETLHPNPFVWLVCKSVRELVHSLDRSLIPQIESNDSPELDLQQLDSDL
jgi:hypothetical protein